MRRPLKLKNVRFLKSSNSLHDRDDLILVGRVVGAHGVKGNLKVNSYAESLSVYETETGLQVADALDAALANRQALKNVFIRIADRGAALHAGVKLAQADDIVIALGKGHEQSMCFGQTEYPWDDREALRAALRGEPLTTLPTARPDRPSPALEG